MACSSQKRRTCERKESGASTPSGSKVGILVARPPRQAAVNQLLSFCLGFFPFREKTGDVVSERPEDVFSAGEIPRSYRL